MKGLLYKEWAILTGSYKKMVLVLTIVYGGISVLTGMAAMAYALMIAFAIMITSTIAFDENSHWDTYARTLPVTPAQIVGVKYLFGLGGLALGTAASSVILLLSQWDALRMFWHAPNIMKPTEVAATSLLFACIALLFVGLLLPLSYKFNSARARSWTALIMGIISACCGLAVALIPQGLQFFLNVADREMLPWLGAALAVMLVLYFLSYKICVEIYTRKEY